jgi:hypothetical protein
MIVLSSGCLQLDSPRHQRHTTPLTLQPTPYTQHPEFKTLPPAPWTPYPEVGGSQVWGARKVVTTQALPLPLALWRLE